MNALANSLASFESIFGSGCQVEFDSQFFIDQSANGYAGAFGSQSARHRYKCDANIFRNRLEGFFGRRHILNVFENDAILGCAARNHVVQNGMNPPNRK
jgi:hypothetical protein